MSVQQQLVLSVCSGWVYVPAWWSLLQGFILIFNQKSMIAFQWIREGLHYVITQHFYQAIYYILMVIFKGTDCSVGLSIACSRTEWDPLSCGHHYHDADRFFHLSWYWPFLTAIGDTEAERMCSMQPCGPPERGMQWQLNLICCTHTVWPIYSVYSI